MGTEPIIRPFTSKDLQGSAAALVKVHETDGYPVEGVDHPEKWISSPGVKMAWVAVSGEKVLGHVAVMVADGEASAILWQKMSGENPSQLATLARLFVVSEARGKALGERLARTAMEYAQERSLRLVLDVMLKDRAAIRLYERLGWRLIGQAPHLHSDGQSAPAACYVWPGEPPPSDPGGHASGL